MLLALSTKACGPLEMEENSTSTTTAFSERNKISVTEVYLTASKVCACGIQNSCLYISSETVAQVIVSVIQVYFECIKVQACGIQKVAEHIQCSPVYCF